MHPPPAFQFVVDRFGAWRAGVLALVLAAAASMIAWLAARDEAPPPAALAAWALGLFAVAALAASLLRMPAAALRWDASQWWLARPVPGARRFDETAAAAGEIEVALDLGGWMLLRFRPSPAVSAASSGAPRAQWIAVQRRGLEAHWHALRCAVYSPRPAPARDAEGPPS
jgi:hypothetical protein